MHLDTYSIGLMAIAGLGAHPMARTARSYGMSAVDTLSLRKLRPVRIESAVPISVLA